MGTDILLLLVPVLVFGYNLDTSRPILYSDPSVSIRKNLTNDSGPSYFGYSVLLYRSADKSSWLIVGAPRGNYVQTEKRKVATIPGAAYRCQLFGNICTQAMPNDPHDITEESLSFGFNITIHKAEGWFGAAMSIYPPDGKLIICAPRTSVIIRKREKIGTSMHGLCYNGLITSATNMIPNIGRGFDYDYNVPVWRHPMRGFSIKYSMTKRQTAIGIEGLVNYRIHGSVQLMHSETSTIKKDEILDVSKKYDKHKNPMYFGYSMTSGYFFGKDELMFAGAAPGFNYTGAIIIMKDSTGFLNKTLTPVSVRTIKGDVVGQYFGASLAAGDLNNDGLDDLIVGAPHWKHSIGKVYIYLSDGTGDFVPGATLSGNVKDGQFGYALVSGDLDGDGFADVIVGAPWEDSGVVYIFNGGTSMGGGSVLRPSQRISGSDIFQGLQRFGYSFSELIDIDDNGYPEVAVGAYKSGHVVILRGKPVLKTKVTSKIYPTSLSENSTSFQLEICIQQLLSEKMQSVQKFKIEAKVDEVFKRIEESDLKSLQYLDLSKGTCTNYFLSMASEINNLLDPIIIHLRYQIEEKSEKTVVLRGDKINGDDTFCASCAMESRESSSNSIQLTIPFDVGCEDATVCHSNITANAMFLGVRDKDTWVIGSDDISLEIQLENDGEMAHLTMVVFSFPEGVMLSSIMPSCREDKSNKSLRVTCDVGNLANAMHKSILLGLDMKALHESSLHNKMLDFNMNIETRSFNQGISNVSLRLRLVTEAALSITGKANEESYYFSRSNENNLNIIFQHTYQILKLGATSISDFELTVDVPIATGNYNFLSVYEPQLFISDRRYECSSRDIVWFKPYTVNTTLEDDDTNALESVNVRKKMKLNSQNSTNVGPKVNKILENQTELSNEEKGEIIYLNCFTAGVQCARIKCHVTSFKKTQDIDGKLFVRMVLDVSPFNASSLHIERIIHLSSNANVTVTRPSTSLPIAGTISTINVTTAFYGTPKKLQKPSIWILLGSLFLGLSLLCIIIGLLCWVGFFERKTKEALDTLTDM